MPAATRVSELDLVELTEPVDEAPAGARGGVLDIFDGDMAMVEFTNLPGEMDVDKIVVVPLGKLRVLEHSTRP